MVTRLRDYTLVALADNRTHLADPYSRTTLCGQVKRHARTMWPQQAMGTGCHACQTEAITRLARAFAQDALLFEEFVQGKLVEVA